MSAIKEWECKVHGNFECTHPMCPEIGCTAEVKQVFLTPPTIGSQALKRFNAGIKKSADMMGISDFRSARAGETAYGNSGKGMLWGDEVKKVLGVDMSALVGAASKPLDVTKADGTHEKIEKSVMRELAGEGITRKVLPKPAEAIGHRADRAKPR